MPLVERVATVTGEKIKNPGNFNHQIGTSVRELIDYCGGDGSRELEEEDIKIHESINSEKVIGILNKIDMERKVDLSKLTKIKNWIEISAMKNIGIDEMER